MSASERVNNDDKSSQEGSKKSNPSTDIAMESVSETASEKLEYKAVVRRVRMSAHAREDILSHAIEADKLEAMGLLVGEIDSDECVVNVVQAVPVIIGKEAEVEFLPENYEIFEKDFSPYWIVGWYHSHPGYGLFLSSTDVWTHANGFQCHNSLSVAIVVDHTRPSTSNMAAFQVDSQKELGNVTYVQVPLSVLHEADLKGDQDRE